MAQVVYPQSQLFKTMTVQELRDALACMDPLAPVIFRSPLNGCYGPETGYSIERVTAEHLPRREERVEACTLYDDETGEPLPQEGYTEVWSEWTGVVIT